MPYKVDTDYDLQPTIESTYRVSSHHRRTKGNSNKTVWTISNDEEVMLFIFSIQSEWVEGAVSYGLKLNGNLILTVGYNAQKEELKLGKFVDSDGNNRWHGYPADPRNRKQDIPCMAILTAWKNSNYISKSDVRKIKQQIPCDL